MMLSSPKRTAFGDPLSIVIADPAHSDDEHRWILLGLTTTGRLVVVSHADRDGSIRLIGARLATRREKKNHERTWGQRRAAPEYDFSKGVRGKYAKQYAEGANIVVLEPDVAEAFKTSEEVNAALRKVLRERADNTAPLNSTLLNSALQADDHPPSFVGLTWQINFDQTPYCRCHRSL